jgi:hypothetical protein
VTQLTFNLRAEREKRDRALDLIEENRQGLLGAARRAAEEIHREKGRVTAPEVFARLREWGMEHVLSQHDPRWAGALFRNGWRRLGWESKGSHCRPVSIWTRRAG